MSITLASDAVERLCSSKAISRNELARQIGVTPATAYRVERGRTQPSNFFIAALLDYAVKTYGGTPADHFGKLFEVVA